MGGRMGQAEIQAETRDLMADLRALIIKRRDAWREDHGSDAAFIPIEVSAMAWLFVDVLIDTYTRHYGHRPTLPHMVSCVSNVPELLMAYVATAYNVRVHTVDVTAAAEHVVGQGFGGVREGPVQ